MSIEQDGNWLIEKAINWLEMLKESYPLLEDKINNVKKAIKENPIYIMHLREFLSMYFNQALIGSLIWPEVNIQEPDTKIRDTILYNWRKVYQSGPVREGLMQWLAEAEIAIPPDQFKAIIDCDSKLIRTYRYSCIFLVCSPKQEDLEKWQKIAAMKIKEEDERVLVKDGEPEREPLQEEEQPKAKKRTAKREKKGKEKEIV